MKKLSFAVIFACIVAAVLTSCSSNSPRAVAEEAMKCMQKRDYKGYFDHVYFTKKAEETRAAMVQMVEGMAESNPESVSGNDFESFEFVSEEIDEEKGKAKLIFEITHEGGIVENQTVNMIRDSDGKWWVDGGK